MTENVVLGNTIGWYPPRGISCSYYSIFSVYWSVSFSRCAERLEIRLAEKKLHLVFTEQQKTSEGCDFTPAPTQVNLQQCSLYSCAYPC